MLVDEQRPHVTQNALDELSSARKNWHEPVELHAQHANDEIVFVENYLKPHQAFKEKQCDSRKGHVTIKNVDGELSEDSPAHSTPSKLHSDVLSSIETIKRINEQQALCMALLPTLAAATSELDRCARDFKMTHDPACASLSKMQVSSCSVPQESQDREKQQSSEEKAN